MSDAEGNTELRLSESNDVYFKVSVHGATRPPDSIRLVCETEDVLYSFRGEASDAGPDVVRFVVPPMAGTLKNGQVCEARVEVVVEDRYFVPVRFKAEFSDPVAVVAESVAPAVRKQPTPAIDVHVRPVPKAQYTSLRDRYRNGKA